MCAPEHGGGAPMNMPDDIAMAVLNWSTRDGNALLGRLLTGSGWRWS